MIKNIEKIIVCTDSVIIKKLVEKFGIKSFMTSLKHKNGTKNRRSLKKKLKKPIYLSIFIQMKQC